MGNPTGPVAALDCGTNSTRLLVVGADGTTLDRQMRITRLGEGVDRTGSLLPEAISRTVGVLEDYRRRMDELGVVRARLVATSAARDAANAEVFFAAAEKAAGVCAELLSGDEEGRLSFTGATLQLPAVIRRDEPVLVVDIGGGSTELVVGRPDDPPSAKAVSVDVGCVRISERCFAHDPPTDDELADARGVADEAVAAAAKGLPAPAIGGPVIGLAGTVSTLAAMAQKIASYDRALIHHSGLRRASVDHWLDVLATEPARARLKRPGMVAGREDVIVGGVVVLAQVMARFDRDRCLVSEDDILDGIADGLLHSTSRPA